MNKKVKYGTSALIVAFTLTLFVSTIGKSAVSEMAGLAVAQTSTLWNSVADAAKGDGLSSGLMANGMYLWNGLTFDRLKSTPASDASSATGLMAVVPQVYNGSTYDRLRGGLTADANAVTGILSNAPFVYNGTTYDRMRGSVAADANTTTGYQAVGNLVFNASTWDRQRTSSADALAATGITAAGNMGFNGTTWDRLKTGSATNNTATTSLGGLQVTQLSTWSVTNTATAGTPSASKTAGGGTVRHVATAISVCVAAAGTAQPAVQVNLRDGAAGAGTIIRSWQLAAPINTNACVSENGLNMTGSANTAMTIEFAAATAAATQASVNLSAYSTP